MINIILADDHSVVRTGIKHVLQTNPNIKITGEADSGLGVLKLLKSDVNADIILTDLHMPGMSGMELLKEVTTHYPSICSIMLTMVDDEMTVAAAFENGAKGFLLKNTSIDELMFAVSHVSNGGIYMSCDLSQFFFKKSMLAIKKPSLIVQELAFTARELEVLTLLSDGCTNVEMAERLFLSVRTIEGHRQSLIDKTKSKNTAVLIKYAVIHGLVS
jgi:two-component system response regulator NreC